MRILIAFALLFAAVPSCAADAGTVRTELTQVLRKPLERTITIPGELKPFQRVDIHARVTGFVESIHVDRGSFVKAGQLLAEMSAPELSAQRAEAQARIPVVASQKLESQAKLAAAESTYQRLKEAARTPGAVAGNDIVLAEKAVDAERARLETIERTVSAYEAAARSIEEIEKYLKVHAPFAGVITERQAHTGALAGPDGIAGMPLFTLEEVSRLRLVAAVPEAYRQSISRGERVRFAVSAFPGEVFAGVVARPAYAVDSATRTMPVELDVANSDAKLTPGMYAEVQWPVRRAHDTLFVPATAIQATTERIFVVRVTNGRAEWVDVRRGMTEGDLVEVFGDIGRGDRIVLRGTDEIRPGTSVLPR